MTARKRNTNNGFRRRPEEKPEGMQPWERLRAFGARLREVEADLDEFGRYVEAPRCLMVGISFALQLAIRHLGEIELQHMPVQD